MDRQKIGRASLATIGLVTALGQVPAVQAADMPESWFAAQKAKATPVADCSTVNEMRLFERMSFLRANPDCVRRPPAAADDWVGPDKLGSGKANVTTTAEVSTTPTPTTTVVVTTTPTPTTTVVATTTPTPTTTPEVTTTVPVG